MTRHSHDRGGRGDRGGHRDGDRGGSREITAPYGFVPLGPVLEPEWLTHATETPFLHDVPFSDGVSGTFDLVIENETPLCVAGPQDDRDRKPPRQSFRLPDGTFAIPGSSLRGALRNVVEIASFSRMTLVNDHRYAVRDLHNKELYGKHVSGILRNLTSGKTEPMPVVNAGWLTIRDGGDDDHYGEIAPCHFAKVEYKPLTGYARSLGLDRFNPNKKQSSADKYKAWGDASRAIRVPVVPIRERTKLTPTDYGIVKSGGTPIQGTLVFTGQPQNHDPNRQSKGRGSGNAKHHDFVFYGDGGAPVKVSKKIYQDFCFGHADRGQQNRMDDSPNEEWRFWKEKMEQEGAKVPVFYLLEDEREPRLRAFGLAMMFRLAYKYSIHEALANAPGHDQSVARLDLAEGLFGTVRKPPGGNTLTLRGRVQLGHATAENRPMEGGVETVILSAPKASYYPNYVTQDQRDGRVRRDRDGKALYTTWMDKGSLPRGWKRYHAQTKVQRPPIGSKVNVENVGTRFRPLAEGAVFRARVNVHNLRPEELGALLWAITFGDDAEARHTIGLARPLGFGRVRMKVDAFDVRRLADGEPTSPAAASSRFVAYMESRLPGWGRSKQVQELLAIARPKPPEAVSYQRLDSERRINEFVDAKKGGLALKSWADGVDVQLATQPSQAPAPEAARGHDYSAPIADPPAHSGRRPWPGMRGGDALEVQLSGLSKRGKWRGEAVDYDAKGVIQGTPPDGADDGQRHTVIVKAGGDPKNLVLEWPG